MFPTAGEPADVARTLSEAESKRLLSGFGVPFPVESIVSTVEEAVDAASAVGFPVVVKLNGDQIAHKTERGLVRLRLGDAAAVSLAAAELLGAATAADGEVNLLVAPMLEGNRELIAGLSRDPQFGMTVMLGVGGVLAEALGDVSVRLVPVEGEDVEEMIEELRTQALLDEFRGEPAIERSHLVDVVLGLSRAAVAHPEIVSADLNPILISRGEPIAVDALVEVEG